MASNLPKDVEALGVVLNAVKDLDETQMKWVFASAMSNLGIGQFNLAPSGGNVAPSGPSAQVAISASNQNASLTPKEFLRAKAPQSDVQRIACLAYYLCHSRGQPHFKTVELTALNLEAAGAKMSNPSQAVGNATKQNSFLAPAGGGKKQITSLGEEVVNALPDQEKVKGIEKNKPKKRKAIKKPKATVSKK